MSSGGHDDENMFKKSLDDVRPLAQDKIAPYRKTPSTQATQRIANEERELEELLSCADKMTNFGSGDEIRYLKEGNSSRTLKKLRRGDYEIEDQLDLHGLVAEQAKEETHRFINDCASDKVRAIRIIHGKGINSRGKAPVIKGLLLGWLANNPHVIAACSASTQDGGSGAVNVLLD